MTREFDVALSFAGEDRAYVEMVAEQLIARGITVFYDRYEEADLWGKDLFEHLSDVYRHKAKYTLMFVSKHYAKKLWANHERRAAQARAFSEGGDYILPARFDDTEIPGLLPTTGYLDLRQRSPAEVAVRIAEKLGLDPLATKASAVPAPNSPAESGTARFDFRKFDGRFRLGSGAHEFQTHWSNASNRSIHSYNRGNIRAIGLAATGTPVRSIDVDQVDFTSSNVTPSVGAIVVLQNTKGFYAAVRIDGIQARSHSDAAVDELAITYWILVDGSADFSKVTETGAAL